MMDLSIPFAPDDALESWPCDGWKAARKPTEEEEAEDWLREIITEFIEEVELPYEQPV